MRKAGKAVAEVAEKVTNEGDSILVLAGKGKNGGDAIYAAEYIRQRKVTLVKITDAQASIKDIDEFSGECIIDGLFGIGLNRPMEGGWKRLAEAINKKTSLNPNLEVVAVDTPSGLDGDSGEALGGLAVKATVTVTFGAIKKGMLSESAKAWVGSIFAAEEVGLLPYPFK
ncbi:hypothetical protein FGO68_gene5351 [Halteria grandinella]|uniref:YjeF N-terminal domain-containing protein n=1 Tax=Halteria grandinella TaxID=5974 RepID=A0A8J8NJ49_HALGN|nr:hypothetical protein FGO68_gene5351 [Halteria grandinella]